MTQVTSERVVHAEARAWRDRNFRRLWGGATASTFGAEIAEIAMPLLALLTLSASATELSALRVAQFLPFLLAALPLGLVVDRHRAYRLRLMIGADLGRFLLVASIPVAVWAGVASMEMLYLVVFAAGVLTVLFKVADFAFLPTLLGPERLVDANGKLEATHSAGEIGGRGIGGLLVQALTAPVALGVNALGYLTSALCLSRIRTPDSQPPTPPDEPEGATPRTGRQQVWEGVRVAFGNRYIRPLLGEATTFNFFNEIFLLGLMLWMVRDLHLTAGLIGLVFTAGGIGSFVGAWFGSYITGRFGYGRVLLITLILGNGAPLALAAGGQVQGAVVVLLCAVFVLMGVGIGVANVHAVSLRQTALPEHLTGRTNAAYRVLSWGVVPFGAALGGLVASTTSGHTAMVLGAAGIASATLWVAFSAVPGLRSITDARER